MQNRPYEINDSFVAGISVEMNLEKKTFKRITYSLLDAFADIGGLSKILTSSLSFLAFVLSYDQVEALLAMRLYKIKSQEPDSNFSNEIILPKCYGIKVFVAKLIP